MSLVVSVIRIELKRNKRFVITTIVVVMRK